MHKIDGPGNVAGEFVDEDELNSIPGTEVSAKWLNTMQRENLNILQAAGITPDENQDDQIIKAILQIASGADLIVRFTTTGNINHAGLGVQAGGDWAFPLTPGDLILSKDQIIPEDNGWFVAAPGAWPRVNYLDSSAEIQPGKLTKVTQGTTLADSIWMLTTDAPIVLNATDLIFERKDAASGIKFLASGVPLPSANVGPIWHADYNSVMTVQAFTANGANFTGYASVLVGSLLMDTQPTPRLGYVKSGTTNLSRITYAALRGWAMHHGIMVAEGVWAAGRIAVCDNADGTTFKIFDVRGEFPRYWDDSRGIDTGRGFGSGQSSDIAPHLHGFTGARSYQVAMNDVTMTALAPNSTGFGSPQNSITTSMSTGTETRPRNVALLASIKF